MTISPLRKMANALAADGKIDKADARKLLGEVVKDGNISDAERKDLDNIDQELRSAVYGGAGGDALWRVYAGGIRDAGLLKAALKAEDAGPLSQHDFDALRALAAQDGVITGKEAASLRHIGFGGVQVKKGVKRSMLSDDVLVLPEQRPDLATVSRDPIRMLVREAQPKEGEITSYADDGWTKKSFRIPKAPSDDDNAEPQFFEVKATRTFDDKGRITSLEIDDPRTDPAVRKRNYSYEGGHLSQVKTDKHTIDIAYDEKGRVKEETLRDVAGKTLIAAHHFNDTGARTTTFSGAQNLLWPRAKDIDATVQLGRPVGTITRHEQHYDNSGLRRSTEVDSVPDVAKEAQTSNKAMVAPARYLPMPRAFHRGKKNIANGRLLSVTDETRSAKQTYELHYDGAGRVSEISYRKEAKRSGKVTERGLWKYEYDDKGRLVSEKKQQLDKNSNALISEKVALRTYEGDGAAYSYSRTNIEATVVARGRVDDLGQLTEATQMHADGQLAYRQRFSHKDRKLQHAEERYYYEGGFDETLTDYSPRDGGGYKATIIGQELFEGTLRLHTKIEEIVDDQGRLLRLRSSGILAPVLFVPESETKTGDGKKPEGIRARIVTLEEYRYGEDGAVAATAVTREDIYRAGEDIPPL